MILMIYLKYNNSNNSNTGVKVSCSFKNVHVPFDDDAGGDLEGFQFVQANDFSRHSIISFILQSNSTIRLQ